MIAYSFCNYIIVFLIVKVKIINTAV